MPHVKGTNKLTGGCAPHGHGGGSVKARSAGGQMQKRQLGKCLKTSNILTMLLSLSSGKSPRAKGRNKLTEGCAPHGEVARNPGLKNSTVKLPRECLKFINTYDIFRRLTENPLERKGEAIGRIFGEFEIVQWQRA